MGAQKLCKVNVKTNRGNTIFYNTNLIFLNFNIAQFFILSEVEPSVTKSHLSETDVHTYYVMNTIYCVFALAKFKI